jgi:ceramide glucosyltransferase
MLQESTTSNEGHETDIFKNALAVLALIWFMIVWIVCIIGWQTARAFLFFTTTRQLLTQSFSRQRYRWRPKSPLSSAASNSVPGVTIIRPLKGLDPNIFENLESSFTQEYPLFEILFAIADDDDPVIPVVRELCSRYPRVNSKIIIGMYP